MDIEQIGKIADIAQEQIDKETAKNPLLQTAIKIVAEFIKSNKVMCYGGTAINNLLPPEDRFYDPEIEVPDYDFFSQTPQIHATEIADRLLKEGFSSVEVKPGVHLGTFKVFADYVGVADVSHLDKEIFGKLWKESVVKEGMHYVPPNFLRMSVYLELSRPKGDVSRWKKVYGRLQLLNKHYPMTCPKPEFYEKLNIENLTKTNKEKIEDVLIEEKVILLGFNGTSLNIRDKDNWSLPLDLLALPEKKEEIAKKLAEILETSKIKNKPAYEELLPACTDVIDNKTGATLIRIYETDACHSYHETKTHLMIASIPTLLRFFLSILYARKSYLSNIPEYRYLCTAQQLVDMADDDLPRRYKLLTPITCLGKQKSMIDMRAEKSELYEKLSKDKSSHEYLEYFFTYMPTTMSKTKRREVKRLLKKTLKRG